MEKDFEEGDLRSQCIDSVLLGCAWTILVPNSEDLIHHIVFEINWKKELLRHHAKVYKVARTTWDGRHWMLKYTETELDWIYAIALWHNPDIHQSAMIFIGLNVWLNIKGDRRPHLPSTIQPAHFCIYHGSHYKRIMLTKPALLAHWHQMNPFLVLSIDARLPNGLIP